MKLAILAEDGLGPVVRHRYRAVTPALLDQGFSRTDVFDVPSGVRARSAIFRHVRDADLVLLSRKLFTRFDWALLTHSARAVAFDFDDAVCFRDSSRARPISHVRMRRFRRIVRGAKVVTAGNSYLAKLATDVCANGAAGESDRGKIVVAPTPIDADRFVPPVRGGSQSDRRFRVGWIGSRSTRPYLALVRAALEEVQRTHPQVEIAVMADQTPSELAGLPVVFTPWSEVAEVPFLQSLDAGIMPLPDDPWTRGKCGFKLLQYMACGVPALASPVGVNPEILAHGEAGVLCADVELAAALAALADDRAAARALGDRGRAEVLAKWSAAVLGGRFAAALARGARA